MGFIETPYRKVTGVCGFESTPLSAEEEGMLISQANIEMDNSGKNLAENVARQEGDFLYYPKVDYADVALIKLLQFLLLYSFLGT
jgi:DNA-directed RNA polymerase subunit beta